MLGADFAVALYQRHNGVLRRDRFALVHVLRLAADIRLVCLDCLATAADRAFRVSGWRHGFADTLAHEPCRLIGHAKGAMNMMSADAFLCSRHQERGQQPLVERDFRLLENRADRHRVGLLARLALVEARARAFAFQFRRLMLGATVRAYRAFRPTLGFQVFAGLLGIAENRIGQIDHVRTRCVV